jgi:HopA1 effector protein family
MQQLADPAQGLPVAGLRPERLAPSGLAGPDVSLLALQYAARWSDGDPEQARRRLYRFNSVPRNPVHQRLLGDPVAVRQQLIAAAGLDRGGLAGGYRLAAGGSGSWLSWRSQPVSGGSTIAGTRKVYVTVAIDQLPAVLRAVIAAARDAAVPVLKFGADYANLRRPDRIVIYVRDQAHATAVADALRPVLDGIPATELPFAERLAPSVYTGLDPPNGRGAAMSWRGWVCRMLASALDSAAEHGPDMAVAAALRCCRDRGIDPARWSVPDSFFAHQPAGDLADARGSR